MLAFLPPEITAAAYPCARVQTVPLPNCDVDGLSRYSSTGTAPNKTTVNRAFPGLLVARGSKLVADFPPARLCLAGRTKASVLTQPCPAAPATACGNGGSSGRWLHCRAKHRIRRLV